MLATDEVYNLAGLFFKLASHNSSTEFLQLSNLVCVVLYNRGMLVLSKHDPSTTIEAIPLEDRNTCGMP